MTDDPDALFESWLAQAKALEPDDATAMALATADARGRPSVRMVLLKGHDAHGFVFYTNMQSRKGDELAVNPWAALMFHWKSLRRQVRIEGRVETVSEAQADAYFASRSRDSQLSARASDQSRPMASRAVFEARFEDERQRFHEQAVPRPAHWSGYRVVPEMIEFWTDRPHRLHDRRLFIRGETGWTETLLYP